MKKLTALLMTLLLLVMNVAFAEEVTETVYHGGTWSFAGYSLTLMWEEGLEEDEELKKTILDVFFDKYPAIRETFGTTEERTLTLLVSSGEKNYISSQDGVGMSYDKLKNDPRAFNTLVWFFVNKVTNGHPNPENDPEINVLSLGFQYYAENVYAVDPDQATWLMPYEAGQQLTDNGQVAGAFIKWVTETYDANFPIRLNRVLHDGYYKNNDFWTRAVGNSLENLWNQYAQQSSAQ